MDTDSCKGVADFAVLEGKPGAEKAEEEPAKDEKKEEGGDEKAEEKEEKRLRQDDEKAEEKPAEGDEKKEEKAGDKPVTYMSATATGDGSCTFSMVWAESWDADWADDSTWPEGADVIQIPVQVGEAKKEEKKEDAAEGEGEEKKEEK